MAPVLIILLILLTIAIVAFTWWQREQRKKALAAWAESRGLYFTAESDYGLEERFGEFDCLRHGDNRYAYNIMEGSWGGRAMLAFDYHYATHSTGSRGRRTTHHHYFSAVILQSSVPLKPLFIRPEGFFDKVTEFFGFDDIDFESAEFSRKFFVKAPDKRWAYDVIHQRMMEFLLAMPQFTIKFAQGHVIVYRSSMFSTDDFEAAAEVARGILDRLSDYLVKEQMETYGRSGGQ